MHLQLKRGSKTVAAAATPEVLGDGYIRFFSIHIVARKAVGTPNAGNVTIQLQDVSSGDWTDDEVLQPGDVWSYGVDPVKYGSGAQFAANQIKVKVAEDGDGVTFKIT